MDIEFLAKIIAGKEDPNFLLDEFLSETLKKDVFDNRFNNTLSLQLSIFSFAYATRKLDSMFIDIALNNLIDGLVQQNVGTPDQFDDNKKRVRGLILMYRQQCLDLDSKIANSNQQ